MPLWGLLRTALSVGGRLLGSLARSSIVKNTVSQAGTTITTFINEKTDSASRSFQEGKQQQSNSTPLPSIGTSMYLLRMMGISALAPELLIAIILIGGIAVVMTMSYFSILNAAPFPTNIK